MVDDSLGKQRCFLILLFFLQALAFMCCTQARLSYSLKEPQAGCQKTDGPGSFCNAFHYILSLAAFVIAAAMQFQYGSCQRGFLLLDITSRMAQNNESYKSRKVLKTKPKKLIWNIFKCAWVTLERRWAEHEQNNEIACTLQYLLGCPSRGALVHYCD